MPCTDELLETDRLRLRAFADEDEPAIIVLMSNPDVRRPSRLPDVLRGHPCDPAGDGAVGAFCVADRTTDVAVGTVSFGHQHGELEVSYQFLPEHWARGLAGESVATALEWARSNTGDSSVIAANQTANGSSLRLLARLEFVAACEFEESGALQSQLRLVPPSLDPI